MSINPETIYAGIAIAGLFAGPAYILWASRKNAKMELEEAAMRSDRRKEEYLHKYGHQMMFVFTDDGVVYREPWK